MAIAQALGAFQASATQCDSLVASAHRQDAAGAYLFSVPDRKQITVAAFLNLFIAWEEFLELAMCDFMSGDPTLSGVYPIKYVSPPTPTDAQALIKGVQRFFDYGNHDNVRRISALYFNGGYPFEPHLSSISSDLADIRTMRNASAHLSSTTQAALEALAQRIFGTPRTGVELYSVLTSVDPRAGTGNTVLAEVRDKLLAVAELIANG